MFIIRHRRRGLCNNDAYDEESYGAFKINAPWENPSMTMTFERLRFAGWHHDHGQRYPTDHLRQNGASMDIIDCIFEDNTVPMSAVYHVGGGPLLWPPVWKSNLRRVDLPHW